ncbi:MAG TPA: DUF4262 domain-containing protein [Microthrixaceae bacterium]|jgi:hypothetical protein|nr:DUF4262 domain-containing protein [Microthrixaceae bacterium]
MSDVFPDRDMDHDDKIAWVVETNGWCAEPVAAMEDPPTPGYTYTIGFETSYDHPEVVIFGLQPVMARGLIEMLAVHIDAGGVIPDGMFVGLLDNDLPAAMLPVDMEEHAALFAGATRFHGRDDYRVCQFVWPDRNGKMPWDEGYDNRLRLAQPVIGQ